MYYIVYHKIHLWAESLWKGEGRPELAGPGHAALRVQPDPRAQRVGEPRQGTPDADLLQRDTDES